ncbi:hypothetical protein [Amycolatopsis eburnea]|uniref:hypothetical protein n=1 Tax=Amycolatopsis eburnea TaxID=2267691 RepID=UPI0026BFADD6|nr:hypothetical protein [Amycolatopsis eburnea]
MLKTLSIWPLLVDGLLTIATVELWKTCGNGRPSGRWVAWPAFGFGTSLSLVANIGSAAALSVLAVELLNGALKKAKPWRRFRQRMWEYWIEWLVRTTTVGGFSGSGEPSKIGR